MGREIPGKAMKDFPPMVSIRKIGQFVKGEVVELGTTSNGNPVVTLALIDLNGSTQRSLGGKNYEEVEVSEGDHVQVIGSTTDLKDKLPELSVGNVVTITYEKDIPTGKGNPKKIFTVLVD